MPPHLPASLKGTSNDAAIAHLAEYYSKAKPYVGATFDTWQSSHFLQSHDRFTADDVLSVNFLSVAVPPTATKKILVTEPHRFNGLLALIPVDQPFWEAGPPDSKSPQWKLEKELLSLHGVGLTNRQQAYGAEAAAPRAD